MARLAPQLRATGGGVTKAFYNGVEVGRVQNVTISTNNIKVAVDEIGDLETLEHVMNGMRVTLAMGFVALSRKSLVSQGVVFPTNKALIPEFEPGDWEFRTVNDEPLYKVTNCTPSSSQLQVSRDTVWGNQVTFDGTWVFMSEDM